MRRIHKFAAVGVSSLMVTFALTPAALAAGVASSRAARSTASLPASAITGSPAKFSPSTLKGKSKEPSGGTCTTSDATFGILNKESKTEKVTFFVGTKNEGSVKIPKSKGVAFCFTQGEHGTIVGKLSDGKKLTVHVSA